MATPGLVPYLTVKDGAAAIDWYVAALGAVERNRWTDDDGKIGHCELALGDAVVYLAEEWPGRGLRAPTGGSTAVSLHLTVADVDHTYGRAVDRGATSEREPTDAHGQRTAVVIDPSGHRWMFSRPVAEAAESMGDWSVTDRRPVELGYLVLGSPDLDRAVEFYGRVFDWQVERGGAGGGHVANTVFPLGISPSGDGSVTPYFRVDDLDVYLERIAQLGGTVRSRAEHDSGAMAECVDDQGMRFDLWRPAVGF